LYLTKITLNVRPTITGAPVKPKDCSELPPGSNSRVYRIYPDPLSDGIKVYCDMETDGGNWTVCIN